MVSINEIGYLLKKDTRTLWLNVWISLSRPLVEEYSVRAAPNDNNPPCRVSKISLSVVSMVENAFEGRNSLKIFNISICRFAIGMYGMSVNKKISPGKSARKKLNATAPALIVIASFTSWLIKNLITLYKGTPPKPGRTIFFSFPNKLIKCRFNVNNLKGQI